jgi:hypothetical protein
VLSREESCGECKGRRIGMCAGGEMGKGKVAGGV